MSLRVLLAVLLLVNCASWAADAQGQDQAISEREAELEAKLRKSERVQRMRLIMKERDRLLAQREAADADIANLRRQFKAAAAQYAGLEREAGLLKRQMGSLQGQIDRLSQQASSTFDQNQRFQIQQTVDRLNAEGRQMQGRFNMLEGQATQAQAAGKAIASELATAEREMESLYRQANQLFVEWMALVDPFGRLDRGEHEAAISVLTEWTLLDRENAAAFFSRGLAYLHVGELNKALEDMNRSVQLGGRLLYVSLAARGNLRHRLGDQRSGMTDMGQAMLRDKGNPYAYLMRGIAHWSEGNFNSAQKDFEVAARNAPGDTEVLIHMSLLKSACPQSRFLNAKKAMDFATRACQVSGSHWSGQFALAAAQAESGNYVQAAKLARQAAVVAGEHNGKMCVAAAELYEAEQPLRLSTLWLNLSAVSVLGRPPKPASGEPLEARDQMPLNGGGVAAGRYFAVGQKHWVKEKVDRGEYIKLEDGSLWEIARFDRFDTALWIPLDDVVVVENDNPSYPYKLISGDDAVEAKLISR